MLTLCPFTFPGFPDPFAVATVGGEQTHTTSVIKKTLNPYWNEAFDLYVCARNSELKTTQSLFLRLLFFSGFFSSFILDWYLEELADRSFLFFSGVSTKTASSRFKFSIKRSSRRRIKGSLA